MYRIILDFEKRVMLVPKDVTDAVGAETDFGIWISALGTDILISAKTYPDLQLNPGRPGRPAKHRGNMDKWDDEEKAYSIPLSALAGYHDAIPGYKPGSKDRYVINGESISEDAILFPLRNAFEEETIDLAGYKVVTPQLLKSGGLKGKEQRNEES